MKQVESQPDLDVGQEIEKDDSVVQNDFARPMDKNPELAVGIRDIVFQFGGAYGMQAVNAMVVVLGMTINYCAQDLNAGVGVISASLSRSFSALLLFLIDFTRLRNPKEDMDEASQTLVGALSSVGVFCNVFFTYADLGDKASMIHTM